MKTNSYRDIEIPLGDKSNKGKPDSGKKVAKKDGLGRYSDIIGVLAKKNKEGGLTSGD